ncbi:meteorin-like protein isoform X2 [Loxodonta africana]|uniref:meteorin-like protein isoform X2 n=1 Tax=Loxodonta africana TaxID=9785 RepID=UPI0030CEAFEB
MRGAARAARGRAGQLWPRPPAPAPAQPPLLLLLVVLLGGAGAQYSSDLCSWKGSGLTHEAHRKEVEQVYLRCSAGTVEWMYPTGALIVNLRPNIFVPTKHLTVCIKPAPGSSGANVYLEKTGVLRLLVRDAPCSPCSDTEVLLAVCTSDFVVRGSIQDVTNEPEQQESAIHLNVSSLYRQKSKVFQPDPEGGGRWRGHIKTLLKCGVRPGLGDFLFTGQMHFGEAWLGCAPRFTDFQRMYRDAKQKGLNPCEIGTE